MFVHLMDGMVTVPVSFSLFEVDRPLFNRFTSGHFPLSLAAKHVCNYTYKVYYPIYLHSLVQVALEVIFTGLKCLSLLHGI